MSPKSSPVIRSSPPKLLFSSNQQLDEDQSALAQKLHCLKLMAMAKWLVGGLALTMICLLAILPVTESSAWAAKKAKVHGVSQRHHQKHHRKKAKNKQRKKKPRTPLSANSRGQLEYQIADWQRSIDAKTDKLALKYRELAAHNSLAVSDRSTPAMDRETSSIQQRAEKTNRHIRNLEIRSIKGEIAELERGIHRLERAQQKARGRLLTSSPGRPSYQAKLSNNP